MKITPVYKNRIISLPQEIVSDALSSASKEDLKVLLAVYSNMEFDVAVMAESLDMTQKAFLRSLEFWSSKGAITVDKSAGESGVKTSKSSSSDAKEQKRVVVHTSLPHYTSAEASVIIDNTQGCTELLDSCQQIIGKIFTRSETTIVIGLIDHLSLSHEYILLLFQHASNMNKKSVRYIEKMAINFFDRGILSYHELEAELKQIEDFSGLEKYVRKLFGIGTRDLISKEEAYIKAWASKYCFSKDVIKKAYEITITNTKEPSLHYANGILEKWYASGLKTLPDIEKAIAEYQKKKADNTSFSTDDFYEAALMRSYENK